MTAIETIQAIHQNDIFVLAPAFSNIVSQVLFGSASQFDSL